MAMAREYMEATHGKNNGNTLMIDCLVCFNFTRHLSCRRRHHHRRRCSSRKAPRIYLSFIMSHFFLVLRIYEYVSVSNSLDDSTLYISLGLVHHAIHENSI